MIVSAPVAAVAAPLVVAAAEPAEAPPATAARPLDALERLKQRMPFTIDHAAYAARRARASEIFRGGAWPSLASRPLARGRRRASRLAIAFDPARAELQGSASASRASGRGRTSVEAARDAERQDERRRAARRAARSSKTLCRTGRTIRS